MMVFEKKDGLSPSQRTRAAGAMMAAVALVSWAGCAESGTPHVEEAQQALEQAPRIGEPEMIAPVSFVKEVDWREVDGYATIDESLLKKRQHEAAGRSPIPPLLPNVASLIDAAVLMSGEDWYAASIVADAHGISIHGSRRAFLIPGMKASEEVDMSGKHLLNRSEAVVALSFEAFGVAYMIRIDCERPFEDTRCTEDDYILEIAEALAIVPGAER